MSYQIVYSINLGPTHTGIAANLRAQKYTTAGVSSGAAISTGFAEVRAGSGRYSWTPGSNIADSFRGFVEIYDNTDAANVGALFAINPEEGFNLDTTISSRLSTGGATVMYSGPISTTGAVTVYRSDDYNSSDLHQLQWELPPPDAGFPDLSAATWELLVNGSAITAAIALVSQDADGIIVSAQMTSAVTAALPAPSARYALRYIRSSRHVTVIEGSLRVREV